MRPSEVDQIPETLNWDLFIEPAQMRPYNKIYTPWNWRGWWDFGTGAPATWPATSCTRYSKVCSWVIPTAYRGSSTALLTDCAPERPDGEIRFPARAKKEEKVNMPEVEVTWYDGGLTPAASGRRTGRQIAERQRRRRYLLRNERYADLRLLRREPVAGIRPQTGSSEDEPRNHRQPRTGLDPRLQRESSIARTDLVRLQRSGSVQRNGRNGRAGSTSAGSEPRTGMGRRKDEVQRTSARTKRCRS